MDNLFEISSVISKLNTSKEVYSFMLELLTESELSDISKRWQILKMLNNGLSQREIAKSLNVSLCKITRGAKIIKNQKAITRKYLKEIKNDK